VQRRATRLIDECRGFEYCERLKETKLMTFETRSIRGDMIKVCKKSDFFRRDESGIRGHTSKLFKTRVRLDVAKFSFGNRICEQWNRLPGANNESSEVIDILLPVTCYFNPLTRLDNVKNF